MRILLPDVITAARLGSGTNIPEPDAAVGEVAWVSGQNYTVNTVRTYQGGVYVCVKDVTGDTVAPPLSPTIWLFKEPTNRMAPFDEYLYTKARRKGTLTYVISGSFANGLGLDGIEADNAHIVIKAMPSGTVLKTYDLQMWQQAYGEWEYLFGNLQMRTQLSFNDIPVNPNIEITITLSRNDPNVYAAVGWIGIGQWREILAPQSACGATQYGVSVTPKSYALMVRNTDGTYKRQEGRNALIINANLLIDASAAPTVTNLLRQILNIPVQVVAGDLAQYQHISTLGFVSGEVVSESFNTARVTMKVEGNV